MADDKTKGPNRRHLLKAGAGSAALPVIAALPANAAVSAAHGAQMTITLKVNGRERKLSADPRVTLLDALREKIGLTGSKKGCDQGQCGACTVHVDGKRVLSCLTLAASVQGKAVTTIEGVAAGDTLHPMQQAFIDHDAFQCGYCTSGQIMSAIACVKEGHAGSDRDIKDYMSGNICRCGAYPNIVAAIKDAKPKMGNG